jgi:hypothetical protein
MEIVKMKDELLDRLCKLCRCNIDNLFQTVQEARLMARVMLDEPDDRLYHAEDKTWWRREGNRLIAAEPPTNWSTNGSEKHQ